MKRAKYQQRRRRLVYKAHCIDRLILATMTLEGKMSSFSRVQKDRRMGYLGEKNVFFVLEQCLEPEMGLSETYRIDWNVCSIYTKSHIKTLRSPSWTFNVWLYCDEINKLFISHFIYLFTNENHNEKKRLHNNFCIFWLVTGNHS